jgi:hypothetical protein
MLQSEESPVLIGRSEDGQTFLIDGVNVWSHKWIAKDAIFEVLDPVYKTKKKFLLYSIMNNNAEIKFIAGEFSNGNWGFYKPPS